MNLSIESIVKCTGGTLVEEGNPLLENSVVFGASIDSRTIQAGDLFIAFKGEQVDGHDYLYAAKKNGAVAAIVEETQDMALAQIKVDSCKQAMADIARLCRDSFDGKVIAITGSCGKTSTKEILASILSQSHKVSVTKGNQNNELGVPLTLFSNEGSDFSVVEMGAAEQGDISYLMSIADPDVSVITNVRSAHVGRFGSEELIAVSKSEIYRELKPSATAIVNIDEKHADKWIAELPANKYLTFSLSNTSADVFSTDVVLNAESVSFMLTLSDKPYAVHFPAVGMHNVANALCAVACALSVGIKESDIVNGLEAYAGVDSRLQILEGDWGGVLIDDCYNANPASVEAAIDVLAKKASTTYLVLGDMAELGLDSPKYHENIGAYARDAGVNYLLTIGHDSEFSSQSFGDSGLHFSEKKVLLDYLNGQLSAGDVLLVKGSRSAALEEIVKPLIKKIGN